MSDAFLSGLGVACAVTAVVAAAGAILALPFLPARARTDEPETEVCAEPEAAGAGS